MSNGILSPVRSALRASGALFKFAHSLVPFAVNFLTNFCSIHFLKLVDSGSGEYIAAFSIAFIASALADQATLSKGLKSLATNRADAKLFLVVYPRIAVILLVFPLAALAYCFAFRVAFNIGALTYACLLVATNATWLYLHGQVKRFAFISVLRLLAAISIFVFSGKVYAACGCLLLALVLLRGGVGPFSRIRVRHLKIAVGRTIMYSTCRLPGLFFLSTVAFLDTTFNVTRAYTAAQAVYVDGVYKLFSGLAGPVGVIIARSEKVRGALRAAVSKVLIFGCLVFGVWTLSSYFLTETLFFILSCGLLGTYFLLSFSYGIPLCRRTSDEKWLCGLGFVAVCVALALALLVRFSHITPLASPLAALVFLEGMSLVLRVVFRSRMK